MDDIYEIRDIMRDVMVAGEWCAARSATALIEGARSVDWATFGVRYELWMIVERAKELEVTR